MAPLWLALIGASSLAARPDTVCQRFEVRQPRFVPIPDARVARRRRRPS
jgi:hypothetical protein